MPSSCKLAELIIETTSFEMLIAKLLPVVLEKYKAVPELAEGMAILDSLNVDLKKKYSP